MKPLYFIGGFIAGSLVGYFATKHYYDQILDDELNKQKEYFEKEDKDLDEREEHIEEIYEEAKKAFKGYASAVVPDEEEQLEQERRAAPGDDDLLGPYVISPEELGNRSGYDEVGLTWYEMDRVLARNEVDLDEGEEEVITDIEGTIGPDALDRFGEFEEDTVFVRDDLNGVDYIIEREETAYEIGE